MMRYLSFGLVIIVCAFLSVGCANIKKTSDSDRYQDRIDLLSQKLRQSEAELASLRGRQLIDNTTHQLNISERAKSERKSLTEKEAFKELIASYKAGKGQSLKALAIRQVSWFPKGEYSDNALYWLASYYYKNENYGQALKYYSQLIDGFAKSEKRASGLLAKALTYKKLMLKSQAKQVVSQVLKEYPKTAYSRKARALSKDLQ